MPQRNDWESTSQGKTLDYKTAGCDLVMAASNINSLLAHIDELRVFMSSSKIDILAINETKLDSTIHDNEIQLPGFEVVRKDRTVNGRNGGGVCIYLRSNLNYHTRDDLNSELLESLSIEITKPRSKPFLVSTWYRPPSSSADTLNAFEKIIDKIDAEEREPYLLGDINCDLLPTTTGYNADNLTGLFDTCGLSQLITEPTRITPISRTLIDLCITNTPAKIVDSGVLHLGISDHSLVYMVRKTHYERGSVHTIEVRLFNRFNKNQFLRDLAQQPWGHLHEYLNPEDRWNGWKAMLMECIDKHAPLKTKRVCKKNSPWITQEPRCKMRKRDYLKERAVLSNDQQMWQQYKHARNQINNAIKFAKQKYFLENLELNKKHPRKTWMLINDLNSRKCSHKISQKLKLEIRSLTLLLKWQRPSKNTLQISAQN